MCSYGVTDIATTPTDDPTHASGGVLLLCALKDEFDQVLQVTEGLALGATWKKRTTSSGLLVADCFFSTADSAPLKVTTTWPAYMGREQAQACASRLMHDEPIRCLAMTGICAGRRDKVVLGDVIFADRLWSYDAGKSVIEDGRAHFQGDMVQYRCSSAWVQRMQALSMSPATPWLLGRPKLTLEEQEDWVLRGLDGGRDPRIDPQYDQACPDWPDVVVRLQKRRWIGHSMELTSSGQERARQLKLLYPNFHSQSEAFRIHVAPLASGASVVEDEGIFPRLSESMRKVLGVDMESSGVAALAEAHGIPALIAKGVSDYGDPFKDDRYRHFAARAAAECLIALLRQSPDLLPNDATRTTDPATAVAPLELIRTLAQEYPETRDARALWQRAGGRGSEVENIARPEDLWQRLWLRSLQGASARPQAILAAALQDLPGNAVLKRYLQEMTKNV